MYVHKVLAVLVFCFGRCALASVGFLFLWLSGENMTVKCASHWPILVACRGVCKLKVHILHVAWRFGVTKCSWSLSCSRTAETGGQAERMAGGREDLLSSDEN